MMTQTLSFTEKTLEVEFILADGDFGEGNTKTYNGFAVEAQIEKPGPPEKNKLSMSIGGLSYDDMGKLTTLSFLALQSQKNLVRVRAGSVGDVSLSTVFAGEISSAYANFNTTDTTLEVKAISGFYPQRKEPRSVSVNGETTAESLVSSWANEIGYSFVNYGVDSSVKNTTFNGSSTERMTKLSRQLDIELIIDDDEVLIMPVGGSRSNANEIPLLSAESGMIGYPTFNEKGILVSCHYRPDLKLAGLIQIESIVPKANGTWKITKLSHSLTAHTPTSGPWQSDIEAQFFG